MEHNPSFADLKAMYDYQKDILDHKRSYASTKEIVEEKQKLHKIQRHIANHTTFREVLK